MTNKRGAGRAAEAPLYPTHVRVGRGPSTPAAEAPALRMTTVFCRPRRDSGINFDRYPHLKVWAILCRLAGRDWGARIIAVRGKSRSLTSFVMTNRKSV
jgi:hypothetical protein